MLLRCLVKYTTLLWLTASQWNSFIATPCICLRPGWEESGDLTESNWRPVWASGPIACTSSIGPSSPSLCLRSDRRDLSRCAIVIIIIIIFDDGPVYTIIYQETLRETYNLHLAIVFLRATFVHFYLVKDADHIFIGCTAVLSWFSCIHPFLYMFITGPPPTHSVGGPDYWWSQASVVFCRCHLQSVVVCNTGAYAT